jgi:hypothetical protein
MEREQDPIAALWLFDQYTCPAGWYPATFTEQVTMVEGRATLADGEQAVVTVEFAWESEMPNAPLDAGAPK